ncbi:hypothetical protein [Streptomyces sp. NPDC056987]|uniref:hypothetical protein n=1 Tax=Streptomyces sp. NPDC056987 TaxID=3345988 RepID=UPI00364029C6
MPHQDYEPVYQPIPLHPYGQPVMPPQHGVVAHPSTGIDGVTIAQGPYGQPVAYYTAPPAPAPAPLVSPLLIKAALASAVLAGGGVGIYFLTLALAALVQALITLVAVLAGGAALLLVLKALAANSKPAAPAVTVQARGRAKVQIHTGRGHNRGRR